MSRLALTNEQKVLLYLTAKSVAKCDFAPDLDEGALSALDWAKVIRLSKEQAVPLCTYEALGELKRFVPDAAMAVWKKLAMHVALGNMVVAKERRALHTLMAGKPYVILKGAAAAAYYPDHKTRVAGDIDFLIQDGAKQEYSEFLQAHGYEMSFGDHANHWVYTKGNAHLEMHFEVPGVPFGRPGEIVREFLNGWQNDLVVVCNEDGEFCVPDAKRHALILMLHMQHHMLGDGLGLRHIADWVALINATRGQEFWQDVVDVLGKIGLLEYARVITAIGVDYLHLTAPEWLGEVDGALVDEVLQDVFASGNFGASDKDRKDAGIMVSENGKGGTKHGSLYTLAHTLHGAVLRQYPIVKKVWILYPFLYVYKALRFVALSIVGKRPNLVKLAPEAAARRALYKKLRVFETENKEK